MIEVVGGMLLAIGGGLLSRASLQLLEVRPPVALQGELAVAFAVDPELPADMAQLLDRLN